MVIVWSERAKRDLTSLSSYADKHSPRGARRITARILTRVGDLADMPEQGSLLPKGLRRIEVTQTRYLLIIKVEHHEVRIVRILHGSRNRRS